MKSHAGETMTEEMIARRWSFPKLAKLSGIEMSVLQAIHQGKSFDRETGEKLSDVFGTSKEFWNNLQSLYQAEQKTQEVKGE